MSPPLHAHVIDTGLGAGNIGDDAMFLAAYRQLGPECTLSTEIHSLKRAEVLPREVNYLGVEDDPKAIEESIRSAHLVLLIGGTPVMEGWGLEWPLGANAGKLQLCHELQKSVAALGVGVDQLEDPEALQMFQEYYLPIASWSVRSRHCKRSLLEMGVPAEKVVVGADWAWLLDPRIETEWADEQLRKSGATTSRLPIGINLVNEIWKDNLQMKKVWGALLDRLIEKYDAQVFFFCNESREGEYFDQAAADEVRQIMLYPVSESGTHRAES